MALIARATTAEVVQSTAYIKHPLSCWNFATNRAYPIFRFMAESFGSEFTIVEVTSDGASEPTTQMWLALAKPSQAVTLVLAAVPEGSRAEIVSTVLTEKQQRLFEEVHLKPGDVYKLTSE